MAGPISSTAAVFGPTAAASSLGVDGPAGAVAVAGTKRGTPPASRTRLTRPA